MSKEMTEDEVVTPSKSSDESSGTSHQFKTAIKNSSVSHVTECTSTPLSVVETIYQAVDIERIVVNEIRSSNHIAGILLSFDESYLNQNFKSFGESSVPPEDGKTGVEDVSKEKAVSTIKRGLKRRRNEAEWKKNKAKTLRNSGQPYVSSSSSGKQFNGRALRPPCDNKCRLQCSMKIKEEIRKEIFRKYWALKDLARQRDFIAGSMESIKPKYRYSKTDNQRRLNHAFFFEVEEKRLRVCKHFFMATLDINDRPIRTVVNKKSFGFVEDDLRGKHGNHSRVAPEIKNSVHTHIESIPKIRKVKSSREYITGGKSLSDLYRDYQSDCQSKGIQPANFTMYSKIFNEEFNISFIKTKKDQGEKKGKG